MKTDDLISLLATGAGAVEPRAVERRYAKAMAGGALAGMVLQLPKALVVTAAGLALFNTLAGALAAALRDESHREAALLTFVVAASGVSIAGLGAPLWAVLAGGVTGWLDEGLSLTGPGTPQNAHPAHASNRPAHWRVYRACGMGMGISEGSAAVRDKLTPRSH